MPRPLPRLDGIGRMLALLALLALAGCDGSTGPATTSGPSNAPPPPPVLSADSPAAAAPAAQGGGLRRVIGEKTTDIRNLKDEMGGDENVRVSENKITEQRPIALIGNAYVTAVGKLTVDTMKHAVDLFNALEGRYPKDYDEFMERIVHENNIALPQLPAYQEYAYDEDNHALVVLEYPDRKAGLRQQVHGEAP